MKLCGKECEPICDFCLHFRNGWVLKRKHLTDGYCRKHKRNQDLIGQCKDYFCFMAGNITQRWIYYIRVERATRKGHERIQKEHKKTYENKISSKP